MRVRRELYSGGVVRSIRNAFHCIRMRAMRVYWNCIVECACVSIRNVFHCIRNACAESILELYSPFTCGARVCVGWIMSGEGQELEIVRIGKQLEKLANSDTPV